MHQQSARAAGCEFSVTFQQADLLPNALQILLKSIGGADSAAVVCTDARAGILGKRGDENGRMF